MNRNSLSRIFRSQDIIPALALSANWFAGLSLGFFAARFYGDSLKVFLYSASVTTVSFAGTACVTMFPLFLSACAVSIFHSCGIYIVCLLQAFFLGLMCGSLAGVGGLFLGILLFFSSLCGSTTLLWYCWRRLCGNQGHFWMDLLICAGINIAVSAVDYWMISPFLAYVMIL